ncbi:adenosylcobinamide amidohydrolase [uncultured Aliiroseovarius sp.]|uniref:adenosylcobinamide amidohydrolase n=1 Tax=uncultured Aliiroseovarius sp. TaxID=1658783 RepID=UPI002592DF06|nr:adenosylcobinamide amidohydrolase [uncultured Aliiroseovarius sp.]
MTPVDLDGPWMELNFGAPLRVVSWVLNRPGFITADRILWREVRNADLTPDLDVAAWLEDALAARGRSECPCFLTSRDVRRMKEAVARVGDITARCVATVGLSNAERVGQRMRYDGARWGTINIAVQLDCGLNDAGLLEATSIVAQARTAAVMDQGIALPVGIATGTGTDCIAVAAPPGALGFAGLHTDIGEAIGRCVYDAMTDGVQEWKIDVKRGPWTEADGAAPPEHDTETEAAT